MLSFLLISLIHYLVFGAIVLWLDHPNLAKLLKGTSTVDSTVTLLVYWLFWLVYVNDVFEDNRELRKDRTYHGF